MSVDVHMCQVSLWNIPDKNDDPDPAEFPSDLLRSWTCILHGEGVAIWAETRRWALHPVGSLAFIGMLTCISLFQALSSEEKGM